MVAIRNEDGRPASERPLDLRRALANALRETYALAGVRRMGRTIFSFGTPSIAPFIFPIDAVLRPL